MRDKLVQAAMFQTGEQYSMIGEMKALKNIVRAERLWISLNL